MRPPQCLVGHRRVRRREANLICGFFSLFAVLYLVGEGGRETGGRYDVYAALAKNGYHMSPLAKGYAFYLKFVTTFFHCFPDIDAEYVRSM